MLCRELINRSKNAVDRPNHTVPNGTDPYLPLTLAMNCQATIVQSLRDGRVAVSTDDLVPYLSRGTI
jgi:hypothetical protein